MRVICLIALLSCTKEVKVSYRAKLGTAISAPHSGRIDAIAITDEGDAAFTADTFGGNVAVLDFDRNGGFLGRVQVGDEVPSIHIASLGNTILVLRADSSIVRLDSAAGSWDVSSRRRRPIYSGSRRDTVMRSLRPPARSIVSTLMTASSGPTRSSSGSASPDRSACRRTDAGSPHSMKR